MAVFKFNKNYRDKELNREVKANDPVDMTIERADDIVKNIRKQNVEGYESFGYERVDEHDPDDKFDREAAKDRLKELNVEFKGNASNDTLKQLLEENEQPEGQEKNEEVEGDK